MPTCGRCHLDLPREAFFQNSGRRSGVSSHCKSCFAAYESSPDRRAKRTWNTLNARVLRQSSYEGIKVKMSRDDFLQWAIPEYQAWQATHPNETPSLDRIDPTKHYELGNLRIIERGENARLASNHPNVHAPKGKSWCGACKAYLLPSSFWRNARAFNGLQSRCKACLSSELAVSKKRHS